MSLMIREIRDLKEDMAAMVVIDNAIDPEHPSSLAEALRSYEAFDKEKYVLRYYLAEVENEVVGYAAFHHMPHRFDPQRFWVWVAVHPNFQGRGIGSALFERTLSDLRELKARWLTTSVREDWPNSIRFLLNRGFSEVFRTWEQHLDLRDFQFEPFQKHLKRAKEAGVEITCLSQARENDPRWREKLYALHTALVKDIPAHSPFTSVSFEEFQRRFLEDPQVPHTGFFLAIVEGKYVGESFVFKAEAEPGVLYQSFTGVLPEHRGKGIAMALKLHVIQWAKDQGYSLIKTWNASVNAPILAINERLGFKKKAAWIEFERIL